jgi:hypothetical protein
LSVTIENAEANRMSCGMAWPLWWFDFSRVLIFCPKHSYSIRLTDSGYYCCRLETTRRASGIERMPLTNASPRASTPAERNSRFSATVTRSR